MSRRLVLRLAFGALALLVLAVGGALLWGSWYWREDIRRTLLDPGEPFQTYRPPPAPDYARPSSWAMLPANPAAPSPSAPPADVFFVHPTTYDGGGDWNAPINHEDAAERLARVMLPNYAGPFERAGRVFAPRYRQASLYAYSLTLRDDARDARAFAYGDVLRAFRTWRGSWDRGRPLILVGADQGGALVARLVREEVQRDPVLLQRLVAAYMIETVVPADVFAADSPLPACTTRAQARCVLAWRSAATDDEGARARILDRALVWGQEGQLTNLGQRPALCVNPLLGAASDAPALARLNLGAANATDLEPGVRPAFLAHQVAAQCVGGLLRVSRPESPSLRPELGWADRRRAAPYNVFYADIEADALARLGALAAAQPADRSASSARSNR